MWHEAATLSPACTLWHCCEGFRMRPGGRPGFQQGVKSPALGNQELQKRGRGLGGLWGLLSDR